jgi:hypothetical protein
MMSIGFATGGSVSGQWAVSSEQSSKLQRAEWHAHPACESRQNQSGDESPHSKTVGAAGGERMSEIRGLVYVSQCLNSLNHSLPSSASSDS